MPPPALSSGAAEVSSRSSPPDHSSSSDTPPPFDDSAYDEVRRRFPSPCEVGPTAPPTAAREGRRAESPTGSTPQAKRVRLEYSESEATPGTVRNQLVQDAEVNQRGLIVNGYYRMLICANECCGYALQADASQVQTHLRKHKQSVSVGIIGRWLARHGLPPGVNLPTPGSAPISGIEVVRGLACGVPGCTFAAQSESVMSGKHRRSNHPSLPSIPYVEADVQQPYRGRWSKYVVVGVADLPAPPPDSVGEVLRGLVARHWDVVQAKMELPRRASESLRDSSPWLSRSGIVPFVGQFSDAVLIRHCGIAHLPRRVDGWLGRVIEAAGAYYTEAVGQLREGDDELRRAADLLFSAAQNGRHSLAIAAQSTAERCHDDSDEPDGDDDDDDDDDRDCVPQAQQEVHDGALQDCEPGASLVGLVHDLVLALLTEMCDGRPNYETAVLSFFFLRSLNRHTAHFLPPFMVTGTAAALSYVLRAALYRHIVVTARDTGDTTFSVMETVIAWVRVGRPHVFDALRGMLALARNIAAHSASPDTVFWSDGDLSSFRYRGHTFHVAGLRNTVAALDVDMRDRLRALFGPVDPEEPSLRVPRDLVDDPSNFQPGYSFMSESENGIDRMALATRLLSSGRFCKVPEGSSTPVWDQDECVKWKKDYWEFSCLRAALCHLLSGQPSRATEALEALIVNGDRRRSIIAVGEPELLYVLDYNKTRFDMTIIRAFDPALSEIVLIDIMWLRPFAQLLQADVFAGDDDSVLKGYLYLNQGIFGRRIDGGVLSGTLQRYSTAHNATGFNVRDWRHIMTSIARHLIGADNTLLEEIQHDLDYQEGHSSRTAELHYGRERNGLTSMLVNRFLKLSRAAHKACPPSSSPSLILRYPSAAAASRETPAGAIAAPGITSDPPHAVAPALDLASLAANLSAIMEPRFRELAQSAVAQVAAALLDQFRLHGYVPLYPAPVPPPSAPRALVLDRDGKDLASALRALLGSPVATFKSAAQRQAVEAVVRGERHTATLLPTGGGKSLLFLIVAARYDAALSVSVVYVPWTVLALNHVRTCERHGVRAGIWTPESPVFYPVTFVLPESGSGALFHAGLRDLDAAGRLRRFFLDEVHAWIMDAEYRPAFLDASGLVAYAKPIHLMSATVPVDVYHEVLSLLRIGHIAAPEMFRERSVRPSIRYSVVFAREAEFVPYIHAAASRLLTARDHRGIVFVRFVHEAQAVAAALGCLPFHGQLSPAERSSTLASWESGKHRLIVATTLLSTGYHVHGVRLVVEYGAAWNYIAHLQATGRGGRGDRYCEAHTLLDPKKTYLVREPQRYGYLDMMSCFRNERACLRQGASVYIDGFGERCHELPLDFVPCSRCEREYVASSDDGSYPLRRAPVMPPAGLTQPAYPPTDAVLRLNAKLIAIHDRENDRSDRYIKERLDALTDVCLSCWLIEEGRRTGSHKTAYCLSSHNIVRTPFQTPRGMLTFGGLKGDVRVDSRLSCPWCWVPRRKLIHPHISTHGTQCEYQDIIPQMCLGAWLIHRRFLVRCDELPEIAGSTTFDAYWGWLSLRDDRDSQPNYLRVFLAVFDFVVNLREGKRAATAGAL
ncbi:hypothetical protein AURDEDRAFT_176861 [Auricularia subglabra TFB-10046 SS5]|uniref:DNA 3'-5' helicase n=1 Tax=Auricularia subglabra (strain TFB-10046 / SS5) TaxID=717982 RepID=J0WQD2_AURST|nr:hypothetical protein AURDEDRAFT_176861 [Auricularia subglabra TFB-10046 SS5]